MLSCDLRIPAAQRGLRNVNPPEGGAVAARPHNLIGKCNALTRKEKCRSFEFYENLQPIRLETGQNTSGTANRAFKGLC